ncbi:MAG: TRAP transporter fused permease subunit [Proteobacteria bacterium]|nr:TRAP transporter fused permease subunit [Pseudomonadota bacterium]MBU4383565.1 TRAP transporter fused permease subunit [Pseudomonadota bacterium]
MSGLWAWFSAGLGVFMVLFYFYNAGILPVDTQYFLGIYVLMTYILVFINYPATMKHPRATGYYVDNLVSFVCVGMFVYLMLDLLFIQTGDGAKITFSWLLLIPSLLIPVAFFLPIKHWGWSAKENPIAMDLCLAAIAAFVVGYYIVEYAALNYRMGSETSLDTAVSVVGILVSLEVARRVLGWSMTLVGVAFLFYAFWGNLLEYIPVLDSFAHTGFAMDRALNHIYLKQEGVYGIMASVLVTYVILFIFFGSFLKASGCSRFFLDLPMALAGRTVGGPAKVAVMASGFFGSVSGSAIANTVSTGAFTIPLMKKAGFRPHVAGAIEPAASIGGMFMPPIMGAGGFLMAEFTEIPYVTIMKMAVFPAIIYFLSVFVMVHFEAKRYGLVGKRDPNAPTAWDILKSQWLLSAPLVVIVVLMLVGYSPGMAAFWATITCVAVSWTTQDNKMGFKEILGAMIEGARNTLIIGATVGVIGIIVGTIALTGIGLKFSQIIIELSSGYLPIAILLIGLASLVLGMGVPVTAAYLITAVLAVGAVSEMIAQTQFGMSFKDLEINTELVQAGYAAWVLLASHMIVYWFSQDSNITPPVCVAAYAGAAIAGSDPWKTGWTSFKFAKMLYVGPFLFAFAPGFLLTGTWYDIVLAYFTITLGTIAFGSLTMGYMLCPTNWYEWVVFAAATALLFFPGLLHSWTPVPKLGADFIGIALVALVYLSQRMRIKKDPSLTLPIYERHKLEEAAA